MQWTLKKIRSKVREMFERTTANLETLAKEKEKWQATLQVFASTETPEELIRNIKNLDRGLSQVEEELNENLSKLIRLESEIVEISTLITDVKNKLELANEERSKNIFVQNQPAIWNVIFSSKDADSLDVDSANIEVDTVMVPSYSVTHVNKEKILVSLDFIKSHEETVFFFFILWALTIALSLKYGRRHILDEDIERKTFAKKAMVAVHDSLIASSSYLSILYVVFLFEYIPLLLTEVLILILISLNVYILYKSRGKKILRVAILLAVAYIIGQTNIISILNDLNFRFYLFLKVGITFWVLKLFIDYLKEYKQSSNLKILDKLDKVMYASNLLLVVFCFS